MTVAAPFVSRVLEIQKDWIDYNGHLNMAYYNVLFDLGADEAFACLGMGLSYAQERRLTTYTAEIHVCYVRELHLTDKITCSVHLLDHDEKRFHFYQELRHLDGWLAATCENLTLHVDMNGPKVCPMPADILANLDAMRAEHAVLPTPERAGRSIRIKRKAPL
jgi:acyl-CoA thioester hydrolase